jgi:hypothetical protein
VFCLGVLNDREVQENSNIEGGIKMEGRGKEHMKMNFPNIAVRF